MSLQQQWDPTATTLNGIDRLTNLMRVATMDNVQPAALIAYQAIGTLFDVDSKLIGEAVDVLGGKKSFRIENLKIAIGISSGGVARHIRESTFEIRGFLLATGLRLHLQDEDVADLLFEILDQSGLLKRHPVSPAQLAQLVRHLDPFSSILLQSGTLVKNHVSMILNKIGGLVPLRAPENIMGHLMPSITRVLLSAFESAKSEEIQHVTISGSYGALWVASILLWLLSDRASVHIKPLPEIPYTISLKGNRDLPEQCLAGDPTSKVRLRIIKRGYTGPQWEVREWFSVTDVRSEIIHIRRRQPPPPLYPTHSLTYGLYSTSLSAKDLLEVAILVPAILRTAAYQVSLIDYPYKQKQLLHKVCSLLWLEDLPRVMATFGWPMPSSQHIEETRQLSDTLSGIFMLIADDPEDSSNPIEGIEAWRSLASERLWIEKIYVRSSDDRLVDPLTKLVEDMPESQNDKRCKMICSSILQCCGEYVRIAFHLADHIFLQATQRVPENHVLQRVCIEGIHECPQTLHQKCLVLEAMVRGTMEINEYFDHVFDAIGRRALSTTKSLRGVLAVSYGEHVAYVSSMERQSISVRDSLAIFVRPGSLRWRGSEYDYIFEGDHKFVMSSPKENVLGLKMLESAQTPDHANLSDLVPEHISISLSFRRESLLCQFELSHHSGLYGVDFTDARKYLALAFRAETTSSTSSGAIQRFYAVPMDSYAVRTITVADFYGGMNLGRNDHITRTILKYNPDDQVNFFRIGASISHLPLVIQGSASLAECIAQAEEKYHGRWRILPTRPF